MSPNRDKMVRDNRRLSIQLELPANLAPPEPQTHKEA